MHAFNDVSVLNVSCAPFAYNGHQIFYSMAFLGIVAAGGIFAGTNPSYTSYELAHAIRTANIKYFIVEADLLPNVLRATKETGIPESSIFVFNTRNESVPSNLRSWTWLLSQGSTEWERFHSEIRCKSTIAARLFSSGTTGLPKALNMSFHNFIAQHTLVMEHRPRPYNPSRLICNPMFHVSQVPRCHTSPLRSGYKTVIMRRFELNAYLTNIKKFQVTELNLVPMIVVHILTSGNPLVVPDTFASLRNTWSGAAPLDKMLQARFKKLLRHDAPFNQCWGMSDTSCIATMYYYPDMDTTGGVGRFIPNHDAKLVDDDGKDITAYGVRGELCVRGPCIVAGYFGNVKVSTDSWDEDNYFHTGDIAYCDEKTKSWYIVDRKKVSCVSFRE